MMSAVKFATSVNKIFPGYATYVGVGKYIAKKTYNIAVLFLDNDKFHGDRSKNNSRVIFWFSLSIYQSIYLSEALIIS